MGDAYGHAAESFRKEVINDRRARNAEAFMRVCERIMNGETEASTPAQRYHMIRGALNEALYGKHA